MEDIAGVRPNSGEDFLSRACSALRYRAVPLAAVDLDSDAALVSSLGELFPLVTVYNEDDDPRICFVGAVRDASRGKLRLRELSPAAVWDESDSSWTLREVTRVDVDGPYERALDAITRRRR